MDYLWYLLEDSWENNLNTDLTQLVDWRNVPTKWEVSSRKCNNS